MKLLAVDVGNTSTAIGLWFNGRVTHVSHVDGGVGSHKAEIAKIARELGRGCEALAYLSVVPAVNGEWRKLSKRIGLRFIEIDCGLFPRKSLDYPNPETIGADRLADAAAALDRYGAPAIVCDFGTAFTSAVITADGVWRGGVIAPGFPLMRDYLFERTAKLPKMKMGGKCPKIGRSTEEAMRFGVLVGYRGMVREIVRTLSENFGGDFKLIATGGFSRWVLRDIDLPFVIDGTLTLHGAGLLAARSLKKEGSK